MWNVQCVNGVLRCVYVHNRDCDFELFSFLFYVLAFMGYRVQDEMAA